jgi:hypothetical protein
MDTELTYEAMYARLDRIDDLLGEIEMGVGGRPGSWNPIC